MAQKVTFLIAGTQKGGTSALAKIMNQHEEILMASTKEIHYFDNDDFYLNDKDHSKYHSFFKFFSNYKAVGEATPMYMYFYDAPRRIWQYNKDMKFILLLRNPIERAYSSWNMECHRNIETLSFMNALKAERDRRTSSLPHQLRNFAYMDRGFYSEQIKRIWNYFPKNQTLILQSESLKHDQNSTLNKIYKFLGVQALQTIASTRINSIPYLSSMTKEEYFYLLDIYKIEITLLEQMLGWDCSSWRNAGNDF